MTEPRKARVSIRYEGKGISGHIGEHMESLTYTDISSGECDSITISLNNKGREWMGDWLPSKGDRISAKILFHNWEKDGTKEVLNCGSFEVDDLSFSGRPSSCAIGAVSMPQDDDFNSRNRTKTWEKTSIKEIATEVARRAKISLHYEADIIPIGSIEQNSQTDCRFLYSLCETYGLAMKVFSKKIIIFDERLYEKKEPVETIRESDMVSWSYNTTVAGTYTGVTVSYTDPNTSKDNRIQIGTGKRILDVNISADSLKDAELKGKARLFQENKKATTMEIVIMAKSSIIATSCINIKGLSRLDGKYYVEKVETTVSGESGSEMKLNLRYIEPSKKKNETGSKETTYTVSKGDTLWAIAKKFLGNGAKYTVIYNDNRDTIEAAAKAHGKKDSNNGNLIYAGTILKIREKS